MINFILKIITAIDSKFNGDDEMFKLYNGDKLDY